jgi:hypothetical protein
MGPPGQNRGTGAQNADILGPGNDAQVQGLPAEVDPAVDDDLGVGGVEHHGLDAHDAVGNPQVGGHAADGNRIVPGDGHAQRLRHVQADQFQRQMADGARRPR